MWISEGRLRRETEPFRRGACLADKDASPKNGNERANIVSPSTITTNHCCNIICERLEHFARRPCLCLLLRFEQASGGRTGVLLAELEVRRLSDGHDDDKERASVFYTERYYADGFCPGGYMQRLIFVF